jgi:hypothetical protein
LAAIGATALGAVSSLITQIQSFSNDVGGDWLERVSRLVITAGLFAYFLGLQLKRNADSKAKAESEESEVLQ